MSLEPGIRSIQLARAWAALPAAGAWDATPIEIQCAGAEWIAVWIRYARGAADGAADIRADASPYTRDAGGEIVGNQVWGRTAIKELGALVAGQDVASLIQREGSVTYTSTAAGNEDVLLGLILLMGSAQRIRLAAAESGDTDTPGSLEITLVLCSTGGQSRPVGV